MCPSIDQECARLKSSVKGAVMLAFVNFRNKLPLFCIQDSDTLSTPAETQHLKTVGKNTQNVKS